MRLAILACVCVAAAAVGAGAQVASPPAPAGFEAMEFRCIGPYRGGRVTAVAGVRGKPLVYYQGACGGGVWKTTDAGATWQPISDKFFQTGSVGALAVAESDPNVIYAGMGEAPIRGNVSHGDGVWKSTDAGKTWTSVGLRETRQIARVRVHPTNPDLVYVAALGHVWGPNAERGIYRSKDGGKSWERVLHVSEKTGASDLVMDPANPRILYAGMWQVRRWPWKLESGGPEGGVWRTSDGGDTWKKLAGGLPEGVVGKVGVTVSRARPERVWALVEAEEGGLFRSDDGGGKWTLVSGDRRLRQRAWYYTRVYADPRSADVVYVLNVQFLRSGDGGKTFAPIRVPHGDNHDLWIDPDDPERMIESNDGGANVTFNGGQSWSSIQNQPTAQFYRVTTDNRFPYRVYGAQQDNSTVCIPSRTTGSGIDRPDWHDVGGCESGWIAPHPREPDVVYAGCYGGSITRYDHRTGQERQIVAWPQNAIGQAARDLRYRFQWNAPILISPHDPGVLYHASQKLLMTRNEGQGWVEISPDLTRNDAAKLDYSGGPITRDNTGVEVYGTIFALAESPHEPGVIWAGSDDGRVHLTRDLGKGWTEVTPAGLPEWIQINSIEVSPHERGAAYVAATMYKHDDFRPWLLKTGDYGKTWTKIVDGIPDGAFTRVVREDPTRRGLLYAGTETGLYVSFDDGARWERFQRNLPVVPITDLVVKEKDLVVATQGRAFWILDDLTPLHEHRPGLADEALFVHTPRPAVRMDGGGGFEESEGAPRPRTVGQNPANGVVVWYRLKEKPGGQEKLTVEFLEGEKVLRRFTSEKKPKGGQTGEDEDEGEKPLEPKAGLNRVVWDLRVMKPTLLPKAVIWGNSRGPKVGPGTYAVRVKLGDRTVARDVEVRPHPMVQATADDLAKQFRLLSDLRDRLSEAHEAVAQIRDVRAQAKALHERAEKLGKGEALKARFAGLKEALERVERKLVNPDLKSSQDVLNFPPALDHQIAGLAGTVASADAAPTDASWTFYGECQGKLAEVLAELGAVLDKELADFNQAARDLNWPPVMVVPPKPGS